MPGGYSVPKQHLTFLYSCMTGFFSRNDLKILCQPAISDLLTHLVSADGIQVWVGRIWYTHLGNLIQAKGG